MDAKHDTLIQPAFAQYETVRIQRDGMARSSACRVQAEHITRVIVDGKPLMEITCSPEHVDELVVGRLFSEGIVSEIDGIKELSVSDFGRTASVTLACKSKGSATARLASEPCSTIDSTNGPVRSRTEGLSAVHPIPWSAEWIFSLADLLRRDTPMHRATMGTHSCFLARGGVALCMREDIGRHNAFDKVIGFALMNGIDLTECLVFSSGRIPVDMVSKAIRAGVPILASKAVTTSQTIALARQYDLTLICSAHSDSLEVYCDPTGCAFDQRPTAPALAHA